MAGLMKRIKDFLSERGIDVLGRHKGRDDDDWSLVDCGWLVVHLMSSRARSFYEIEKLWFQALPVPSGTGAALSAESDAKASRQE
jgi:ribosome-associated protein